jgi:glutamate carboxypeptidase
MKGGIVLMLYALKALQAEGVRTGPVSVFLCGDEELGSVRGRPHIEALARRASWVLVVEGSVPPCTAVIRRWGVGAFRLLVQGRAAHVLDAQGGGVNACRELALKVLALEDLSEAAGGIRVSVNVVQGGSARQVTAGEARAEVDVRVRDAAAVSALEQAVRRTAETPALRGASCTLSGQMTRPPMQPNDRTQALLALAEEVGAEVGSPVVAGEKAGGSDGSFAAAMGVATLDGMGPLGYDMCGEQERIESDCLVPRTLLLARLLQRLGEKPLPKRRS